jgi:hypothetical protein
MPTETQPQRDDAVASFRQRMQRYQVELVIVDRSTGPWTTAAEKNANRYVVTNIRTSLKPTANVVAV